MPENSFTKRWTELFGLWAAASGIGTFMVHAAGYLALRQQLTALGIETDLAVVDERYLFAGLRFCLHLVLSLPQLLLLLALPAVVAWVLRKPAAAIGHRLHVKRYGVRRPLASLLRAPKLAVLAGIVLSVVAIQFVMRQIFLFDQLLLRPALPRPQWLARVLLDDAGVWQTAYFGALLLWVTLTAALLASAWRRGASRGLCGLLAALVLVQGMLLPITYGSLTAGREVPRIAWPPAAGSPPGEAWLVWETDKGLTLLARQGERRRIVRIDKDKVERLETLCADPLLRVLHAGAASCGQSINS